MEDTTGTWALVSLMTDASTIICTWSDQLPLDNYTQNCLNFSSVPQSFDRHSDPRDQEYRRKLSHYVSGIGGSVVCSLGTVANALSVAVLTRKSMRSSTYAYLAALAVCDSLVLLLTFLLVFKDTQSPDVTETPAFYPLSFPYVHPSAMVFQVTSIWLTLAFTVDRYIMICHPFKAETMCRRGRARKVIIFIYIAGVVFNIPKYLEYKTEFIPVPGANESDEVVYVYVNDFTPLGKSAMFRELVHSWLYLIFICGIPFLSLVILNAFLIRAVRLSRQRGREINPKERHRNDTTVMLIGVIIIFLICQGPALVSRMIFAFAPGTTDSNWGVALNEVGNIFVLLNSAVNIVPYYLFSRKFRNEFWVLFCQCFFDKDELRRIIRSYSVSVDHRRLSQHNAIEMNGIFQKRQGFNVIVNEEDSTRGQTNHIYSCQRKATNQNRADNFLRHSDTTESVAAPLITSTNQSLSSAELQRDTSTESIRNISSTLNSPTLSPLMLSPVTNGHSGCYMTVTESPRILTSQWLAQA